LTYYDKVARDSSSDRDFIIGKGFQEWLLAVTWDKTASAMAHRQREIRAPRPNRHGTDIVVLIANLIGGVIDGEG